MAFIPFISIIKKCDGSLVSEILNNVHKIKYYNEGVLGPKNQTWHVNLYVSYEGSFTNSSKSNYNNF